MTRLEIALLQRPARSAYFFFVVAAAVILLRRRRFLAARRLVYEERFPPIVEVLDLAGR